ncbi:DMT family transporter [Neotabrizicola sp. sgz301269]|uniref:DMT family transporter n=1 Tax=Neotabrizicola sp. sgz301269 TaxID=3276282 RepID=UPI00376FA6B8
MQSPAAQSATAAAAPQLLRAGLWMLGSIASFSAMAIAGRMVKDRHDTFEILAFRSLLGIVIVLAVTAAFGQLHRIRARRLHAHAFRNAVHFSGQSLWFFALASIPLAQVIALEFSAPLWVVLFSPLFLGERLTVTRLIAALIGLGGVMVVARPDFGDIEPGLLAAAAAALFFAATTIITKRLTRKEDIVTILFWLVVFQAGFGLILAGWDGQLTLPDGRTLPWLLVIGATGLSAHFCLTSALALAPASQVVPIDFARLPLLAVLAALIFDEPLTLGLAVGALLILFANWLSLRGASAGRTATST